MENWLINESSTVRLLIFLSLFIGFSIWEFLKPDHTSEIPRSKRWLSNISLVIINTLLIRLLFPMSAILFSDYVVEMKWGVLQIYSISKLPSIILGVVILDFIIYLQHVMFHAIPGLWKLHRMHHADLELDVTSGTRFHPIEILISMGIKFAAILLFGVSPVSVLLFEVILNGMAMFNHSNIFIPEKVDALLKVIIVTPSMHRIHHSIQMNEYNSNYGFNLSIWDRLLGTFKNHFKNKLILGLPVFRDLKYSKLGYMMAIPFIEEVGN